MKCRLMAKQSTIVEMPIIPTEVGHQSPRAFRILCSGYIQGPNEYKMIPMGSMLLPACWVEGGLHVQEDP